MVKTNSFFATLRMGTDFGVYQNVMFEEVISSTCASLMRLAIVFVVK